jgi:hypothetical protein
MRWTLRLALVTLAAAIAVAATAGTADAALFFLFDRATAAPNDRVTLRTGATPRGFVPRQRLKPSWPRDRIYLLPSRLTTEVHSRFDPRLEFVGVLVRDTRGRGVLTFTVPPLDPTSYTIAYWCPSCARFSFGRTFVVQNGRGFVEPYRSQALLKIAATQECPVTIPNRRRPPGEPLGRYWHGNGLLWASLRPDGVRVVARDDVESDGSIFDKLGWATTPSHREPAISGRRLDAPAPPLRVLTLRLGESVSATGRRGRPSWASAVVFPTAGCWRLTARVRDVSLTYVVQLVIR